MSKANNFSDNNINMTASLPLKYRHKHNEFHNKVFDLREKYKLHDQKLQVEYNFKDSSSYVCFYRVSSSTEGYNRKILGSFISTTVINLLRSDNSLKDTPNPKTLEKLFKINSKASGSSATDCPSRV